jgi:hypothetical protein
MAAHPCPEEHTVRRLDLELAPLAAVLWLASLVRVTLGIAHGETFTLEPTLASMVVLLAPLLVRDGLVWCWRRLRAGLHVTGTSRSRQA